MESTDVLNISSIDFEERYAIMDKTIYVILRTSHIKSMGETNQISTIVYVPILQN